MSRNGSDRQHDRNMAALAAFRAQGCAICGEPDERIIDAHHVYPEDKWFALGSGTAQRGSVWRFAAELAKCIPLCPTCHRRVDLGIMEIPPEILEEMPRGEGDTDA